MTLVVAAVCPYDPSLQLPPDCQVSEVASLKFSTHCTPRQNTSKCKKDTKSLPPLFGPQTHTLVPVPRGPGRLGDLSNIKVIVKTVTAVQVDTISLKLMVKP